MALYMQGAYKTPTYPVYVGKPAALVSAQMSAPAVGGTPIKINPEPTPVYNPSTPAVTTYNPVSAPAVSSQAPIAQAPAPVATPSTPEVDLAGIWELAGQMADNEINPQLAEIDRQLQQAGYSAEESQKAINEAYPVARRSLQKSIYENMVAGEQGLAAMGTGRGGARQELLARGGEREAQGIETIETQRQRDLAAIQRALENYRSQLGTQRTSLVGQRGALQSAYAEQIRGNRFNEAATRANLALAQAQLAENARQFNEQLAENTRRYNLENIPQTATAGTTTSAGTYNTGGTSYVLTDDIVNNLINQLGINSAKNNPYYNNTAYTGNVYSSAPNVTNKFVYGARPYITNQAISRW